MTQSVIEFSALSAAQQACLQTAVRCNGLSRWDGLYVAHSYHPAEVGKGHRATVVKDLQQLALLEPAGYPVRPTNAGIELFNCATVAREVRA